jgi:hypothetical protein
MESKKQETRALEEARDQFRILSEQRIQEERKVAVEAPKELDEMRNSRESLVNPTGTTATINGNDLQSKTVDELMKLAGRPPYNQPHTTLEQKNEIARNDRSCED